MCPISVCSFQLNTVHQPTAFNVIKLVFYLFLSPFSLSLSFSFPNFFFISFFMTICISFPTASWYLCSRIYFYSGFSIAPQKNQVIDSNNTFLVFIKLHSWTYFIYMFLKYYIYMDMSLMLVKIKVFFYNWNTWWKWKQFYFLTQFDVNTTNPSNFVHVWKDNIMLSLTERYVYFINVIGFRIVSQLVFKFIGFWLLCFILTNFSLGF